jgi:serine/threonine protein kinase
LSSASPAQARGARACASCGVRFPTDALFCPNDGTPLHSSNGDEPEEDGYLGQEIAGHIELRQLVGIGAMGRVYRAFQRGIDRDVAVKILHRELSANAQLVSRFTREAKVASRLQHPNVVQVLLAGQLADRALYMAMEFLDGLSLQSAILAAGGALPLARALHITLQLCEAAGEAHAQGIVHRDLKPENVMLVRRGADEDFVKVLDFGIARINWGEQSVATAAGLIFGTARYISPEGAQGHAVGPASDVYAIATLLYQMLAGRTPFEGEQAVGLLVQQIHDTPPSLRSIARATYVPEPIADVIMANLAKDPTQREPDARALGQVLVDAAVRAGLSPEEISRPLHRRSASAMQLPSLERTRQLDLTPEVAARMAAGPLAEAGQPSSDASAPGGHGAGLAGKPPGPATVKWEPPGEFQAKIAAELANVHASSPSFSEPAPLRARASSVDATLDDASVPPPPASLGSAPRLPTPAPPSASRTVIEESRPPTQYTPPVSAALDGPRSEPRARYASDDGELPDARPPSRPSPRGGLFVVACFALGVALAAGVALKMGKLGGEADPSVVAARATDAMFANRFAAPPGDNVKDITSDAVRRWPGDRRVVEIRERAASALLTQALAHRTSNDAPEALRLARLATELDPKDATAHRLVDQIEAELASAPSSSAPPLPSGASPVKATQGATAQPGAAAPSGAARASIDVTPALPKVGQPAEVSAKVAAQAALTDAAFVVSGPGLASPARAEAVLASPNLFKSAFAFPQAGRYEVAFVASESGKAVRAVRTVTVQAAGAAPRGPAALPSASPAPATGMGTAAPTTTTPPPAPTGSVKWL